MIRKFFDFIFDVKSQEDTGQFTFPLQRGSIIEFALGYAEGYYTTLSDNKAMQFYRQSSAVSTAVDKIAMEVEQITPVLKNPDGSYDYDHPAVLQLKNPNDFKTGFQFMGQLARDYLITNNCFIYAGGTINNPPKELYAVKPNLVSATEGENGFPSNFIVGSGIGSGEYKLVYDNTGARYFAGSMRELYQMTGYTSRADYLKGDSKLLSAVMEIYQQIKGKLFNVSLLDNGGKLTMVVNFDENLSEDQIRERLQRLKEQWSGADKAGILGIQGHGTSFEEFGKTARDMDFHDLDKTSREIIFIKYGIPLPLISNEHATYNNFKEARLDFLLSSVLPTYETIAQAIGRLTLPRYGLDPAIYSITYNPFDIPALKTRMVEELERLRKINVQTIDEYRIILGLDPLPIGGDSVLVSDKLIPAGTVRETSEEGNSEENDKDEIPPEELNGMLNLDNQKIKFFKKR